MAYGVPPLDLDRVRDGDQDATADAIYSLWLAYNQAAVQAQRAANLDAPPTFTSSPVVIDGPKPSLVFYDAAQGTDLKAFQIIDASQVLSFQALNDPLGTVMATPLVLTRNGDATVGRHASVGGNLSVTGSGGNVACKDQSNTFTQDQIISKSVGAVFLVDTGQAANARVFRMVNTVQTLRFNAMDDAMASNTGPIPLILDRLGNAFVGTDIYEKGRPNPMGSWIAIPFNAPNYGATGGTFTGVTQSQNSYTLIGKTATISLVFNGTIGGTPSTINVALPLGNFAGYTVGHAEYQTAAGWDAGHVVAQASVGYLAFQTRTQAAWAAGPMTMYATITVALP